MQATYALRPHDNQDKNAGVLPGTNSGARFNPHRLVHLPPEACPGDGHQGSTMKNPPGARDVNLALALALVTGGFLRLYLLSDQILADDEWHGLYYVLGKTPGWLLTHFSIPGATCIPLNFYTWALGASLGWSETLLRLPSVICGLACLLASPFLVKDLVGPRRAAWFALLLAISPLLIFYSRICRPYSAVALFGFVALVEAARWRQTGRHIHAASFVMASVLAVYFHLFAVVTIVGPILAGLFDGLLARWSGRAITRPAEPSVKHWAVAALIIAVLSALLVAPALIGSLRSTFFTVALAGRFRLASLVDAALLISGTGQRILALCFWAAFFAGAIEQCRRDLWWGCMLLSLFPLHALALVISRPDSVQSAIVLLRYCIPLVPVSLLLAACGLETGLEALAARVSLRPTAQGLIGFALVAALCLGGPLPQCYIAPNNFTSHGAYQHHYERIDWSRSFYSDLTPANFTLRTAIRAEEVSPFYGFIAQHPNGRPLVEYPMLIGDHFDLLYYYQHMHRRRVLAGYTADMSLPLGLAPGNIYGSTYIDQVLSLVPRRDKIRFRDLVSMNDLAAMRARKVEYIVLHKRFEADLPAVALPPPDLRRLYEDYQKQLGPPAYEDANLAAFRL